ncbi:hypothetical protein [Cohnella soli]|uniref:Uncharacterized protein n=1 Tax=Cohnella soli TaxID=425005 RepID=A0ABW0HWJ1_9BACL
MAVWKKHAAFPVLALAISVIVIVITSVYSRKDNGTFYWKDLSGSRDAIGIVAIGGELRDGYHRTSFRLQNGKLSAQTEVFEQARLAEMYRYISGGYKRIGNKQYYIDGQGEYRIHSLIRMASTGLYAIPEGTAIVSPSIYYRLSNGDGSPASANPLEYGLAGIGDKVFFTVPVSYGATGTSGIYELSFTEWYNATQFPDKNPKPRQLAEISLEANESDVPPNIEILGLEAVGDKLALLSVEHNELHVTSYDSKSGKLLGKAIVPQFYLSGRPGSPPSDQDHTHDERYEAYSDNEHGILNISFGSSKSYVLSFDFNNGVKLLNAITASFPEGVDDPLRCLTDISYRDNKLYIVKTFREQRPDPADPSQDRMLPLHFYLYVYDHEKLVYKGELVTALNDDTAILGAAREQFSIEQKDFRYFTNFTIE